jgi:hypothetical protein
MDTSIMEYTAEDLIAHKLQRSGILVAKPKFDQEGADLLALDTVNDGAKFCRIQCKGRSLINSKSSSVDVPAGYVKDAFILFLFVETGEKEKTYLFCFFSRHIKTWRYSEKYNKYTLSITAKKLDSFTKFSFNESMIEEIKNVISRANVKEEIDRVIRGYGKIKFPAMGCRGYVTVGNPPSE